MRKKRIMSILLMLCMVLIMLPTTAYATEWTSDDTIIDGWYYLRCMNNYLNLTGDGAAELRKLSENEAFYVESQGGSQYTLKMKDGRYLGLEGTRKDGERVKALNSPYTWLIHWEATNFNKEKSDIFSLRPPEAIQMVVNASGRKNTDGTPLIMWTHTNLDALNHAEFRFIPASTSADPTGESWSIYTENSLKGYKDRNGNVVIKAQFDDADKFSQGIAKVTDKYKGAAAYIDTTGKTITPFKYYPAASGEIVYDGLMRVAIEGEDIVKAIMNGDGVDYSVTENGESIIVMKSGKRFKDDTKYGFINTAGKEVIALQYDEAYSFQDGMAAVLQYQGFKDGWTYHKIGYIDTTGKQVIPYKYGGENMYDGWMLSYRDGMTCFVEYLGAKGFDGDKVLYAPVGVMDKTGKVIIPANPNRYYPSNDIGLRWSDGVITNTYNTEVNKDGIPTKGGGYSWSFVELYDYSGKLIKKLDGYRNAVPLGGGYTLAQHMLNEGEIVEYLDTAAYECYWTVFDRNGNIVVDKAAKNDYYVLGFRADGYGYGYANGYVYFAGESYKVSDMPAQVVPETKVTATPSKTSFVMSNKPVSVTAAYSINNTNYLQLRAIAAMLNGTEAQFDVIWDGQYAVIEPGTPYSGTVTETILQTTTDVEKSGTKFKMNGEIFTFTDARLINGSTNYLQLREFAQKLSGTTSQFNVYWDGAAGQAVIQPGVAYTGSAS